ncbi:MAG: NAD(P)-dependent oxidoreductase [Tunicatimonas sp.]
MKILITGGSGFIGTNLLQSCLDQDVEVLNLDWNPPLDAAHIPYWEALDIMDATRLGEVFAAYQPTHVVHLAARTDTDIYELDGDLNEYIQNTVGTQHVLDAIKATPSVERAIITSSMFVCEAGYLPQHDQDYRPFTLYGVSKKLTEDYTRAANLNCTWTIIRPQTIWGPWSLRYRDVMFRVMNKGLYFHPGKENVRRAYGYVGNVVWQIEQILQVPAEKVHERVFYVGDTPIDLRQWVELISQELTGKPVRLLPTPVVKGIARVGDTLTRNNIRFPLTSTRFNSMTEDYLAPIEKTHEVLGLPPHPTEAGVRAMIRWYRSDAAQVPQLAGRKLRAQLAKQTPVAV